MLVTGVNPGGLGAATAHAIASQSPELLILTYRTKEKIEKVVADLRNAYSSTKIATLQIDLADVDSVRRAAKEVHVMTGHIDVLVNNAGVMSVQDKTTTSSGIEIQFATNHLGHFLFTNLIMDLLLTAAQKASRPGSTRIINLSGGWHQFSPVRFDDINFDREQIPDDQKPNAAALAKFGLDTKGVYIPEVAYAQSKTANILFSVYLTQHLREAGVISFALNPGGKLRPLLSCDLFDPYSALTSSRNHDRNREALATADYRPLALYGGARQGSGSRLFNDYCRSL